MPFLDIFSKKSQKEEKGSKIIVDNREKSSLVISELLKHSIELEFTQLPIADYIINNIAIERKTVSDLKASIVDRRIFDQMKQLEQYEKYCLIIEGILEEDIYSKGIHENAFRGFIINAILQKKIPIIFTHDTKDTAKYLYMLTKKKEQPQQSIRHSRILPTKEEQLQFILEGFPNIGPVKAKKLLEKFKNLKNIFNASEEELKEILGNQTKSFLDLLDK